MRHQVYRALWPGLLQVSEIAECARGEEIGEVLGQFKEGVELVRVLGAEVGSAQAFDLRLELSLV